MVYRIPIINEQMIHFLSSQVHLAAVVATISGKMMAHARFLELRSGNLGRRLTGRMAGRVSGAARVVFQRKGAKGAKAQRKTEK
jgi:hypothetical protein